MKRNSPLCAPHETRGNHGLLAARRPLLETMFSPKTVALIGASERERSVGRTIFENLLGSGATIYPINSKKSSLFGIPAYSNIASVPEKVDLAVIATPAASVPGIVAECAKAGVCGAVIISAGFKECGAGGQELERQIMAVRGDMRIIGPNCLGVMLPHTGLNATFACGGAIPGSVGFLSQSGALCTAVLDWSLREKVGFSAIISAGSMLDVGWGDLIYHLGDDPHTRSIVIYMETIGNARAFLSAAREVSLTKPIIVIKVGRTAPAAKAAASHTGSLTGDDDVLDAAFRRVGVLRVNTIAELFAMAEALGKQPRPRGPRLAIVTNAGGPAGLATDMLISKGGQLAELSDESIAALNRMLPAHWSHNNPVDILGDASADCYAKAVSIAANDANADGTLVILTPQAMTDPAGTARLLGALPKSDKPLLTSWMGGPAVEEGGRILNAAGVATFEHPDTAARVFANMWRHSYHLRSIYETPMPAPRGREWKTRRGQVAKIIRAAEKSGRTVLSEPESKQIIAAYGIPTVETRIARTEEAAVKEAEALGYPVVLKVYSRSVSHKSEGGGVQLGLRGAATVRRAFRKIRESMLGLHDAKDFLGVTVQPMVAHDGFELILGSSLDPQFGPVLLFGAGGVLVEILKDRALGLPPLTATLARRMMEQTRIYRALGGVRGRAAVDLPALEQLLVRFSHLVVEQRMIKEIDINPLLASSTGLMALDARVILHPRDIPAKDLPAPAIRPYPTHYIFRRKLGDGTGVTIRPIQPEDEPAMAKFHGRLSDQTVHLRYFGNLSLPQRVIHERLARICFNDYDREIALVAVRKLPGAAGSEIIGVGRLSKIHNLNEGEFALVVADDWQGNGLGTHLLDLLVEVGRTEKLSRIKGFILPENSSMQHVSKKVGFKLLSHAANEDFCVELNL